MEDVSDEEIDPEEWEKVDEEYVMVDLVGLVDKDNMNNCDKSRIKLIGMLDAEKPVLQLDDGIFIGTREDVPGTCILFQKDKPEEEDSSTDEEDSKYKQADKKQAEKVNVQYYCSTQKKLVMHQTFLSKKSDPSDVSQ